MRKQLKKLPADFSGELALSSAAAVSAGDSSALSALTIAAITSADAIKEEEHSNQEQNDDAARPAISGSVEGMDGYDVVFIGYPIWWGQAPKIVYTFLESYDFSGKIIVPFCTSGGSGIDGSLSGLQALTPDADWLTGQRFSSGTSAADVQSWADSLGL